ncbi:transposable element Tcb2 transposase [Trichonephila clavipes]|nr:transposable element Tcb2 transposase [Trichonephila clavipes]
MANNQSVRRPRGTTPADDRYIVLQARRNRRQTAGEIARHTTQATGRPVSRFTVARRLHGGFLFARRPVRCVPLTPPHRRRRSLWCREHRNWRDNEWGRVLFTDESRFSLSSDSHRILIWRERGSRNHPSNIIERDRYGGRGVLVWGGIMLGSRTDLHIFDAGSVNGTRYCNEILLPYVRLFRGAMGLQFLFMDDNAPCHRTVAAEQLLESEDIERMDWPTRSPDLNPIEHVWDFLGRRLAARTLPPVTIRELRLALQDEWAAMPQQLIDTLILSMGRRCETCLAVREIISPTKDRMFLAGHPSQGCFGLQSHCAPCYFFNQASFYPSDFSFSKCCLHYTCPYVLGILRPPLTLTEPEYSRPPSYRSRASSAGVLRPSTETLCSLSTQQQSPQQPQLQPIPATSHSRNPSLSLSFLSHESLFLDSGHSRPVATQDPVHFTSPSGDSVVGGLSDDSRDGGSSTWDRGGGPWKPLPHDVNAVTIVQTTDSSQVLNRDAAVILSVPGREVPQMSNSSGEVRILAHV